MNEILTISQASKLLEVKERTLAEKARAGEVPAHKFLGKWFFLLSELIACIKAQGHTEHPAPMATNPTNPTSPIENKSVRKKASEANNNPQVDTSTFNENQRGQINAANNAKYSKVVDDLNGESFTYQEIADRNNVSLPIVKKVKAGLSLIDKFKLK